MGRFSVISGAVLILLVVIGCGDGDGGDDSLAHAITENDFVADPELSAELQDTVVTFLESPTSEE